MRLFVFVKVATEACNTGFMDNGNVTKHDTMSIVSIKISLQCNIGGENLHVKI